MHVKFFDRRLNSMENYKSFITTSKYSMSQFCWLMFVVLFIRQAICSVEPAISFPISKGKVHDGQSWLRLPDSQVELQTCYLALSQKNFKP